MKEQVPELEVELRMLQEKLEMEGHRIPNMTHLDVPIGLEDVATLQKKGIVILCCFCLYILSTFM